MHIGLVISGEGSVFKELAAIFAAQITFSVVTDRPSAIETFCAENNIPCIRIQEPDNSVFSKSAVAFFQKNACDRILLFCLRLVTPELYRAIPTVNIHPSLLPAFQGFNPLEKAKEKHVRFIGATAHIVDHSIDDGPIIAQITTPIKNSYTLTRLNTISFLQKIYLSILTIELFSMQQIDLATYQLKDDTLPYTSYANPSLQSDTLRKAFNQLEQREQTTITASGT